MPELPEVETVRQTLRRVLKGKKIVRAEVREDAIMMFGVPPEVIQTGLEGRTVTEVGRKGKYWWLEFADQPWLYGHLGMSGWVREIGQDSIRLREHGRAPWEDENGRPRFLKLELEVEGGGKVAFTDGRRLGRLWLSSNPKDDPRMEKLGPDALDELPTGKNLHAILSKRKAPIKALLLDQKLFAGVGNWIADEALYQARISPKRLGESLSLKDVTRLRDTIHMIIQKAVDLGADKEKFPEDWLFHHRWGGDKGVDSIDGKKIVREPVGGRTTAWVPKVQK
ncbi:MAG TPA: DNA-formamidopyrimidine glycosylase family protein [Fimbriimonadaceae bacterium]|nr:DNA-formamidopyrimidine glycosylase family protein [Fimbriimonadaceae bacterium]